MTDLAERRERRAAAPSTPPATPPGTEPGPGEPSTPPVDPPTDEPGPDPEPAPVVCLQLPGSPIIDLPGCLHLVDGLLDLDEVLDDIVS
ncbi:hypothetical protein L3Q67_01145 [Saccharothrix sp. AJ9571]|nr:hypothetical protein L3Q67_01145 [Saccharothrix sp. AJ9571]